MEKVFLHLINISIIAGWAALAVILLRLVLKKAPKQISCILWTIVGVRLVFPFSVESAFSLIPSAQTINATKYTAKPYIETGFSVVDKPINGYIGEHYFEGVTVPTDNFGNIANILAAIWLFGAVLMLAYTFLSYLKLYRTLKTATVLKDNIYQSEAVNSPFILGIIKPKIYLPYNLNENSTSYIVAHEQAHLKRRDHIIKPIAFVLLSVYWFNPMIWIAYILLCRDIELACDEKVIREMNKEDRQSYSKTLLANSISHRTVSACPLAFGEVGVKERIKTVMNYRKPALWLMGVAVFICIAATVCFLTNPKTYADNDASEVTPLVTNIENIPASTANEGSTEAVPKDSSLRVEIEHHRADTKTYSVLTAYNKDSDALWQYKTDEYNESELESITEIGEYNGMYIFNECGTIVALDAQNGNTIWKNSDFEGRSAAGIIDESGNIFACGYYGPDFFAVDSKGNTLGKIQRFDKDYSWPESISKENGKVKIVMTQGPNGEGSYTFGVTLKDYSVALESIK